MKDAQLAFKIKLLEQGLDPKLMYPITIVPELLDLYDHDKLILALNFMAPNVAPKTTSICLRPVIYDIIRFKAYSSSHFITDYINTLLESEIKQDLKNEILNRMEKIFTRYIV